MNQNNLSSVFKTTSPSLKKSGTMARLTKSQDKMLFGVCGGLAEYFNWDPGTVRIIWVLLTLFGVGSPILVYIILAVVMPNQ
jgi:phage shock protein C